VTDDLPGRASFHSVPIDQPASADAQESEKLYLNRAHAFARRRHCATVLSHFRQNATATHFERELGCESGFQEARPPSPPGSSLRVHGFAAHLPTKRRAGRLLTEHERKEYVDPLRG
jgi:hypothetical protein